MSVTSDNNEGMECHEHIVLIITTSPVPSMPSPELISDLLLSLPPCLRACDLILTFDGFKRCSSSEDLKGRAKRGQIPQYQADLYPTYVSNVKDLFDGQLRDCDRLGWGEENVSKLHQETRSVTFIEHPRHLGFALSVKAALKYTSRAFVMVLQHDWHFEADIPGSDLLRVMMEESDVNYITFKSRSSMNHEPCTDQPHHRCRAVGAVTRAMRKDKLLASNLVSFYHFLDRPHLVQASMYRDLLHGRADLTREPFKFRRGDFVEDTLGTTYGHSIKIAHDDEAALAAWRQLGAWMFSTDSGERVVKHASGRIVLAREQQAAKIARYIEQNKLASLTK